MTTTSGSPWQPPSAEELQKTLPQYEVAQMLGRGGMGAVYMGRQISLDRPVAIKILSGELEESDAGFTERFKNEAKAMAKLNHPGIVSVYDFGETEGGLLYIVMEYVDGTDVSRMIAANGRIHTEHAMAITAHVCDALAYAHERGIIHRDIKPANIMVGYDGSVKVADFGLAKVSSGGHTTGLTQSGMAMGTLHFMAPEALILGIMVDHRADIYAVGVMLYQMLTGKLPHGMFSMPSQIVSGLDPRYDNVVRKALMEEREARYQSIREFRCNLDGLLTQPVVKVDPVAETASKPVLPTQARPQRPGGKPGMRTAPAGETGIPEATRGSLAWLWGTALVILLIGVALWLTAIGGRKGMSGNGEMTFVAYSENMHSAEKSDGLEPEVGKSSALAPVSGLAVSPLVVSASYEIEAARQIAEWVFAGGGNLQIEMVKSRKLARCSSAIDLPSDAWVLNWISQGLANHRNQKSPFPFHLLPKVPTLRGFEIRQDKPLGKEDVEFLMQLPDLRKISVGNMPLTFEAVKALTPSERIDHIRLGRVLDSKDDDGVWRHLIGRYPNLTFLETQEFLKAETLQEVLPAFPKLVDFRAYMEFSPEVADRISQVKSLRLLNIKGLGPDHPVVPPEAFYSLAHLQGLYLFFSDQLKSVCEALPKLSTLKELGLIGLDLDKSDLVALRPLGRLEILNLSENRRLDDGAIGSLKGLMSLKELRLERTQVSDRGLALLQAALPSCKISHSFAVPSAVKRASSAATPSVEAVHTWTDMQGRSIHAKFVGIEGSNVVLDIAGKVTPVALNTLSAASQQQARQMAGAIPEVSVPVSAPVPAPVPASLPVPAPPTDTLTLDIRTEDNADEAVIYLKLGERGDEKVQRVRPGITRLSFKEAHEGRQSLTVGGPAYACQFPKVEVKRGKLIEPRIEIRLFRHRFVSVRVAFNPKGSPDLSGRETQYTRLAMTTMTYPEMVGQEDWRVRQGDDGQQFFHNAGAVPWLEFYMHQRNYGWVEPPEGVAFEALSTAPESGYHHQPFKAEMGQMRYFWNYGSDNSAQKYYGKLIVDDVTDTPPAGMEVRYYEFWKK